jgi:hypothetical protein
MRLLSLIASAAVTAVLACAAPLAAQDFTFSDIPWGIDPQATTDALAPMGFVLNTEFTPDEGEVMYEGEDDAVLLASFAGDALVAIRVSFSGTAEQVDEAFQTAVQEGTENLGDPEFPEDHVATWRRGETSFSVMTGEWGEGHPFFTLQYGGPGFEEEIARRIAGMAPHPLPALDPRWQVIAERDERRISFDRTTVRRTGASVVRAWIRNDLAAPDRHDGLPFDRSLDQIEYDCEQLRFRVLGSTYHMGDQAVGQESPAEPGEWIAIVPETVGEDIVAAVCAAAR